MPKFVQDPSPELVEAAKRRLRATSAHLMCSTPFALVDGDGRDLGVAAASWWIGNARVAVAVEQGAAPPLDVLRAVWDLGRPRLDNEEGFDVSVRRVPGGMDPDSFARLWHWSGAPRELHRDTETGRVVWALASRSHPHIFYLYEQGTRPDERFYRYLASVPASASLTFLGGNGTERGSADTSSTIGTVMHVWEERPEWWVRRYKPSHTVVFDPPLFWDNEDINNADSAIQNESTAGRRRRIGCDDADAFSATAEQHDRLRVSFVIGKGEGAEEVRFTVTGFASDVRTMRHDGVVPTGYGYYDNKWLGITVVRGLCCFGPVYPPVGEHLHAHEAMLAVRRLATGASFKIAQAWRSAICDPAMATCRRRLAREFVMLDGSG